MNGPTSGAPATAMDLTVLYRGPLASCDYDCPYCPFAKRRDSGEQLRSDRAALERFTAWAAAQTGDRLSVLFTPWGEGLVRSWYRKALVELSRLEHIGRVAIQTNLSGRTGWLAEADRDKAALWCTYHPGQTPYERFLGRCRELTDLGVRYSVGIVGLDDHLEEARRLRSALPPEVYLWVNAAEGTLIRTSRRTSGRLWTRCSPTAGIRTARRGCPAGPVSRSSRWTATGRCVAVTSSGPSWAISTTAATGARSARAAARSRCATATSAMYTWRHCRCTTSSLAACWSGYPPVR